MPSTITIEIPARSEALIRRVLALEEELHHLAASAPDGPEFDACETVAVEKGRDMSRQMLSDAVAGRVESAEKKGRRSASARAVGPRRTADPKPANSSAPSASSP